MRIWLWLGALALATFGVLLLWREYPWQLALLAGAAVGALARASWKTAQRLRGLMRPVVPPAAKDDSPATS